MSTNGENFWEFVRNLPDTERLIFLLLRSYEKDVSSFDPPNRIMEETYQAEINRLISDPPVPSTKRIIRLEDNKTLIKRIPIKKTPTETEKIIQESEAGLEEKLGKWELSSLESEASDESSQKEEREMVPLSGVSVA
jgi:hypothetical protein